MLPSLVESWRSLFSHPTAYFGFIQLSTWCKYDSAIPEMRDAMMAAALLPRVGYATMADHGAGCYIHPASKQYCAARLANSALSINYGRSSVVWKSPSYASAAATADGAEVTLNDVTPAGLELRPAANWGTLDCTASVGKCVWASVQFNDAARSWVNATVALDASRRKMLLTAPRPAGATAAIATSYAYGPVPMMTVYLADHDLPVLQWLRNITAQ